MFNKRCIVHILIFIALAASQIGPLAAAAALVEPALAAPAQQSGGQSTAALVLVNSTSEAYEDFQQHIQVYLDHFGIPYTTLDIATTPVTSSIGDYAVIIIGHRLLDPNDTHLDAAEEDAIVAAVNGGSGLVNFDNQLSDGSTGRYPFLTTLFGFGYQANTNSSNVTFASPGGHYITATRAAGETVTVGTMNLAGITLPGGLTALATSGGSPLLVAKSYGSGRAVQFGSYDWMSHDVAGPLVLDDLIWRSIVWAARKPFVMQGMLPFVTLRVDDVEGPLDWVDILNEAGFKPWLGLFLNRLEIDGVDHLWRLTHNGQATALVQSFTTGDYFYFDHTAGANYNDETLAAHFAYATEWHNTFDIPKSKYLAGHYYEIGSNAFSGLQDWGVEFITTTVDPGLPEATSPWMKKGPFRLYEDGPAQSPGVNVHYSDFMDIPGHPEFANQFFACGTEIRDADPVTQSDWDPSSDTGASIAVATETLTRALDSMTLATLFTHEFRFYNNGDILSHEAMRTIAQGIAANLAPYKPIYATMDEACQYARAMKTSDIASSVYNPATNRLTVSLEGSTDMPTRFYVFTEPGSIQHSLINVPVFNNSTVVEFPVPGPLATIKIEPNPVELVAGVEQQFTATGYDAQGVAISDLEFTWSVASGGGTIDQTGRFTAGSTPGTYTNTVRATANGVTGSATVKVNLTSLDHFSFDAIPSPQYAGAPFQVTLRARDANENPVINYNGTVALSASKGRVSPDQVTLVNGVWTGMVTLNRTGAGVTLTAANGSASGVSGAFQVNTMPASPITVWDDTVTPDNPDATDGKPAIELGVKFRVDVNGYITGLRFYKGENNTGEHTGRLWTLDGTELAQVTFTNETNTGWQQALFDDPVYVEANTTYVASYFSPSGHYAFSVDYFTTEKGNPPIRFIANDDPDGPNGVYHYFSSAFPILTFKGRAPYYWIDVVFQPVYTPPQNAKPVANSQNVVTNEDTPKNITLTASDGDNDALEYIIVDGPDHGSLTGSGANRTYTPAKNYNGTDSFTFKVNDGLEDSNLATVNITINAVNDPPVANNQSVQTIVDTPVKITLTASDVEGESLTYSIVDGPDHGTLTGTPPNLTYQPKAGYHGQDSFTFKASDGSASSNIATVTITVRPDGKVIFLPIVFLSSP